MSINEMTSKENSPICADVLSAWLDKGTLNLIDLSGMLCGVKSIEKGHNTHV